LGISIEADHFRFEFTGDQRTRQISARQLQRRLTKALVPGTSSPSQRG
jgi:hypothetical protein